MNITDRIKNYFISSYAEARKVNWPTKKQTTNYSLLVIGFSLGMAAFLGILDYFFNFGITDLINRF